MAAISARPTRTAWRCRMKRGYNPYKMGVVGASDSHNTVVAYSQAELISAQHGAGRDQAPKERLAGKVESGMDVLKTSTLRSRRRLGGGEHARIDLRRHEAQGSVRHQRRAHQGAAVRRLGFQGRRPESEGLGEDRLQRAACRWAATSRRRRAKRRRSSCGRRRIRRTAISIASRSSRAGPKSGQIFEKVYDVAWSGQSQARSQRQARCPPSATRSISRTATYTNTIGAVELKKVWKDPEFDPSLHAFYYVRVLQIPTPRWSTYDAAKLGVAAAELVFLPPCRSAHGRRPSGTRRAGRQRSRATTAPRLRN